MAKFKIPQRKKVGRNQFVLDGEGKIVEGLAFDTGNGYYFYSGWRKEAEVKQKKKTRKDYQFGRDYDEAVYLFKQWVDKDKVFSGIPYGSIVESGEPIASTEDATEGMEIIEEVNEDGHIEGFALSRQIDDDEIWRRARKLILQDIRGAAKKLGFPALIEIEDKLLKYRDIPKLTLTDIFDFFWDYNSSQKKEKRMVKLSVKEFVAYIKDEDISNIDKFDIISFDKYLSSGDFTSDFINKRIERVITCLNYYKKSYEKKTLKNNEHKNEIIRVVDLVNEHATKAEEQIKDTPKTFVIKTLKKIFKHIKNDKRFTLINLLAFNCGFYAVDIEGLKKNMIKENNGITYISYPRDKTRKTSPRAIILFDKTVKLLRVYLEENPNNTEYIFLNSVGTNLKTSSIQKEFKKLKEKIKHLDGSTIDFKNYRDTVTSTLVYQVKNTDLLTITIGHDFSGKKNVYWKYVETKIDEIQSVPEILYGKFKTVIDAI